MNDGLQFKWVRGRSGLRSEPRLDLGELGAALGPAARNYIAAATGGHAGTKAMFAGARALFRLIGTLHRLLLRGARGFAGSDAPKFLYPAPPMASDFGNVMLASARSLAAQIPRAKALKGAGASRIIP